METNDSNLPVQDNTIDALARFEQERMNRRAALRKIGLTTGMALFAMFGVDDLARVAARKLEQQHFNNVIAETVAKDFKNIGIAFASPNPCEHDAGLCSDCEIHYAGEQSDIQKKYDKCEVDSLTLNFDPSICETARTKSLNDALYEFNNCRACHC